MKNHVQERHNRTCLWKLSFFFIVLIILGEGCYYDKEELIYPAASSDCSTVNATFGSVKTIMSSKCATAGCHNAAAAAGGTVLETYDQIKAKADRVRQRALVDKTMPPSAPLSASEVAILKCWMSSGMPNN